MRACLVCFKEFEPKGPKDYFCSDNCRGIAAPYKELLGVRATKCAYCGKHFWQKESVNKYCSSECKETGRPKGYHRQGKSAYKPRPAKTYGNKNCEWCGKEYMAKQPYQKWCSDECRWHGSYRMAHPNHKTLVERRTAFEARMLICKQCGKTFHPKYRGEQLYCSKSCQIKGITKKTQCTCMGCGKEFMPRDRANDKYCSRERFFKVQTDRKEYKDIIKSLIRTLAGIHECPICGKRIVGRKYCSDECNVAGQKRNQEARWLTSNASVQIFYKECKDCGKVFAASHSMRAYCSETCKRHSANKARETGKRHRLRENGKVDYSISLKRLIKRDKGICHICGGKVDPKADPNSDMYPSIDHVRPAAHGGMHRWWNVALAHRGCNSEKNASEIYVDGCGQLRWAV